ACDRGRAAGVPCRSADNISEVGLNRTVESGKQPTPWLLGCREAGRACSAPSPARRRCASPKVEPARSRTFLQFREVASPPPGRRHALVHVRLACHHLAGPII